MGELFSLNEFKRCIGIALQKISHKILKNVRIFKIFGGISFSLKCPGRAKFSKFHPPAAAGK